MAIYATCRMTVTDIGGNALPNASVEVNQPGTTTPVAGTLYSDNALTQTLSNPLTTDAYGGLNFYMASAQNVDLAVSLPGYSTRDIPDVRVVSNTGGSMELGASTANSAQNVTSTSTPGTDLTGLSVTVTPDGTDDVYVDVFIPGITQSSATVITCNVAIQKDGAVVQTATFAIGSGVQGERFPVFMRFRDAAPTNASHTYKVSGWSNSGANTLTFNMTSTSLALITAKQEGSS